jgi:hypothetical protein
LSLLNEAREFSEQIIDLLYPKTDWRKKPRTYREKTRTVYLAVAKRKRPATKVHRRGVKQQLQYLRHNLGHIVRFAGKLLERPRKVTEANQETLRQEKAKRADTSLARINSIFLVMNLVVLPRIFFAHCKIGVALLLSAAGQACGLFFRRWKESLTGGFRSSEIVIGNLTS